MAAVQFVLASTRGHGRKPRIFDTNNPGTVESGDPDLGSPNQKCSNGGPGVGLGGEPGMPGENCSPLGYALIIQGKPEDVSAMEIPDGNEKGGIMIFKFTKKRGTYVKDIQLLGIDYNGAKVVMNFFKPGKGWRKKMISVQNLGVNLVQTIGIDQGNVRWLKVNLRQDGAVPSITFCR